MMDNEIKSDEIPSCSKSSSRENEAALDISENRDDSVHSYRDQSNETKIVPGCDTMRMDSITQSDTMRMDSITQSDTMRMDSINQSDTMRMDSITHEEDEFTVSDIYKQATLIGQDIEEINNSFGRHVAEKLMPKLIFVLDKLESAVLKHDDNKSKIKALLLEQDDLEAQKRAGEEKNKKLAAHLNDTENIVETSERKLEMKIKLLKMENKVLSKTVKKKNRKIKNLKKGPSGNGMFWFLDKFLFSGRLFFVTRELPRDIAAIEKLDGVIMTQKKEIFRLSSIVEINDEERDRIKKNVNRLSFVNEYIEHENILMKARLRRLEWNDTTDSFKRALNDCAESINSSGDYEYNDKLYFQNGACVSISDETSESRYWDVLSNSSKTLDEDESFVFEASAHVQFDEDVKTKMATIGFQDNECEDGKIVEIDDNENDLKTKTENENEIETPEIPGTPDSTNCHEVKVDIHANRKDYKKLLLAQELRDSIAIITERNLYDHTHRDKNSFDVKHDYPHDETRYWHEVDSKSSQEDLASVKSNENSTNHLYFILDKDNKSAKKVGLDEYQTVLRRSISSSKIAKSPSHENTADNPSFDMATIQRIDNAIPIY